MDIINGRIFTMEGDVIEQGFVRTKENVIEMVGHMNDYKSAGVGE